MTDRPRDKIPIAILERAITLRRLTWKQIGKEIGNRYHWESIKRAALKLMKERAAPR